MFNLFKLQLTPSSVRCGAGQQVKRRQVVQCLSNGPTEAETATVFGFHHLSLALHVEIIATEVSKQRWLWLYFCLVGASCGKPCDKYWQVTQKMWRTDFYDNCTEVAYTCMQYTGRTAGQHVSSPCLRSLWLCQNDKWSDCPPAPWSRWSFWNCEMWGLREWMRSCWLCLDSSALSWDSHVKVLNIAMGLRSGATMALATSLSAERVFLTEFRLLQIFWTFWIFELGRKKTSLKRSLHLFNLFLFFFLSQDIDFCTTTPRCGGEMQRVRHIAAHPQCGGEVPCAVWILLTSKRQPLETFWEKLRKDKSQNEILETVSTAKVFGKSLAGCTCAWCACHFTSSYVVQACKSGAAVEVAKCPRSCLELWIRVDVFPSHRGTLTSVQTTSYVTLFYVHLFMLLIIDILIYYTYRHIPTE